MFNSLLTKRKSDFPATHNAAAVTKRMRMSSVLRSIFVDCHAQKGEFINVKGAFSSRVPMVRRLLKDWAVAVAIYFAQFTPVNWSIWKYLCGIVGVAIYNLNLIFGSGHLVLSTKRLIHGR